MDIKILFKTNCVGRRIYVIKLAITPINLGRRLIITIRLTTPPVEDAKLPMSCTNDLTNVNLVDDVSLELTNAELNVDELLEEGYIQRIVRNRNIKQVLSNIFNQIFWYRKNCIWCYENIKEKFELLDSILSSAFMFDGKYYYPSFIAIVDDPSGGEIKIKGYKWIF